MDMLNHSVNFKGSILMKSCSYLIIAFTIGISMHDVWIRNLNIYHTILELICVFIALAIFTSIWCNYKRNSASNCILALGFLSVAIFDGLHAFYFLKLNLTKEAYYDLSTRYWIIGRLVQAGVVFLSTKEFKNKINKVRGIIGVSILSFGTHYFTIVFHDYLPLLLTDKGVTPIKIALEYIIIILCFASIYMIKDKIHSKRYDGNTIAYNYIFISYLMMIPSELSFTLYGSVDSILWTIGHVLKIASYYFLFRGIFISTITYSYEELELKHEQLEDAYKKLEQANIQIREEKMIIQQQDKLALLGQLGAGIVHETRNYLTTIKGRCQLIEAVAEEERVKEYAKKINKDVNEVNAIISEFLFLSKPRESTLEEVSMQDIFENVRNIVETSSLMQGVNISMEISSEERYLLCDEVQIKQVILNVCKNAVDAMAETKEPELYIKTGYNEQKNEMFIRVMDNGKGISDEDLKKVGTLFYTTKKSGTGLGLNVCYEIIKEHNGKIEVESKLGEGTSFTIILPCIEDEEFDEVI